MRLPARPLGSKDGSKVGLNLWHEQDLKGERRSTDENDEEKARAWTEDEAVRLFAAPDASDKRRRAYARPLFRELHVIGFGTGMRPDEITPLRPMDVREVVDDNYLGRLTTTILAG